MSACCSLIYRHLAPEVLAGNIRTEATDIYSLTYLIDHIFEEVRLPHNSIILKGLAKDSSHRPKAKLLMSKLIKQRSLFNVDKN